MLEQFFSGIMYMKMLKSLNLSIVSLGVVHCQELSNLANWHFLVFLREIYKVQIPSISGCNYHINNNNNNNNKKKKKKRRIVLRFCLSFSFLF